MHARFFLPLAFLAVLVATGCDRAGGAAGGDDAASAGSDARVTTVNLAIQGMTCEQCVAAIEGTAQRIEGVASCEVSLDEGSAILQVTDPDVLPMVIRKIEKMKYRAQVVDPAREQDEETGKRDQAGHPDQAGAQR